MYDWSTTKNPVAVAGKRVTVVRIPTEHEEAGSPSSVGSLSPPSGGGRGGGGRGEIFHFSFFIYYFLFLFLFYFFSYVLTSLRNHMYIPIILSGMYNDSFDHDFEVLRLAQELKEKNEKSKREMVMESSSGGAQSRSPSSTLSALSGKMMKTTNMNHDDSDGDDSDTNAWTYKV